MGEGFRCGVKSNVRGQGAEVEAQDQLAIKKPSDMIISLSGGGSGGSMLMGHAIGERTSSVTHGYSPEPDTDTCIKARGCTALMNNHRLYKLSKARALAPDKAAENRCGCDRSVIIYGVGRKRNFVSPIKNRSAKIEISTLDIPNIYISLLRIRWICKFLFEEDSNYITIGFDNLVTRSTIFPAK